LLDMVIATGAILTFSIITAALIALAALTCHGPDHSIGTYTWLLTMGDGGGPGITDFRVMEGMTVLAVPVFTMLVFAARSRLRRIPVSVGISHGMRATALPTAGALLLLYGAALVETQIVESNAHAVFTAMMTNENHYDAALVHQPWPAPTTVDQQAKR